jgi:hypothetical protein
MRKPPSERRGAGPFDKYPVRVVPATRVERIGIELEGRIVTRDRETNDDLVRLGRDLSLSSFAGMAGRPGVAFFGVYLEYTFYPPGKPALNGLFHVRHVLWDGVKFALFTIPTADRRKAEQAANRAELRIVDSTPAIITSEGIAFFPTQGPTTFSLENIGDAPCYRGQTAVKFALELEREECDEIVAEYKRVQFPRGRS